MRSPIKFTNSDKPDSKKKESKPKAKVVQIEIEPEKETGFVDFSLNSFLTDGVEISPVGETTNLSTKAKNKTSKKKKETRTLSDGTEMVPVDDSGEELSLLQSNQSYESTYEDTRNLLKNSIVQIDMISADLKNDLDQVRGSKMLKKKYDYIPEMSSTISSLLGTKLAAIRELNKTITDSHNLELKRMKELDLSKANEVDDDKFIMDTYNAFIGMGDMGTGVVPNMGEMMLPNSGFVRANVGESEGGYTAYTNNMSDAHHAMRYEDDPNVKVVVMYDQNNGGKWFDVINIQSGESLPNVPRPDAMFLEDTTIDINTGIARNVNIDTTYPVIVVGGDTMKY